VPSLHEMQSGETVPEYIFTIYTGYVRKK